MNPSPSLPSLFGVTVVQHGSWPVPVQAMQIPEKISVHKAFLYVSIYVIISFEGDLQSGMKEGRQKKRNVY